MSFVHASSSLVGRFFAAVGRIVRAYAEVFFLSRTAVGFILVVGTLLNWRIGAAGLLSVVAAYVMARVMKMDARCLESGYYTYNPLLVGLSLGATLSWSWLTAVLIVVGGVMTFLLTAAMVHSLRYFLNLPPLSLPFVVSSALLHTAAMRYSSLSANVRELSPLLSNDYGLPLWIAGFCKSLGAIFFVPSVLVGGLFSGLLLVRSRILFGLAVGGYYLGAILRGSLVDSFEQALVDVYGFNFILVAMAVGGVFLVPSGRSFLIAAAAVCTSVVLVDAVQVFGYMFAVPAYTLPFNIVTLGVLYALGVNQFPGLAKFIGATPEETLENDLVRRARFSDAGRTLSPPFFGRWTVWQAFDDRWTHQGAWRHAYDFVFTDDDGATHLGDGLHLRDYFCYRKPVLAPCRGRVVKVVDELPDNPPGRVDKANNWGNHVVILDDRGFHVELSHFSPRTIRVKVGDRVEPGQQIGLCGNSGYSPQPHLHVHVQATEHVGSPTLPFSFVRYVVDDVFHSNDRPASGSRIESATIDHDLEAAADFLLDDELTFDLMRDGVRRGTLTLTVKMALDGTLYFDAPRRGKLYFGKHDGTFYFYRLDGRDPWLGLLYAAMPRLPLVAAEDLTWRDVVPVGLVSRGLRRAAALLIAPFWGVAAQAHTTHRYLGHNVIQTKIVGPLGGLVKRVRVELSDDGLIRRVDDGKMEMQLRTESPATVACDRTTLADDSADAECAEMTSAEV